MAGQQDSFVPDSFVPDKKVEKDSFVPDSFVPDIKSAQADSFTPDSFVPDKKEEEKAGWVIPGRVSPEELNQIAAKHPGVNPEELRDWVNYYGGVQTDASLKDWAKAAAGSATESLAVGVPQFLAKKAQDETHEKALDELSDLVNSKKSTAQKAAEIGGSIFGSLGLARAAGKAIPAAAEAYQAVAGIGGGAASGLAHSKTGEEAEGAVQGGGLGLLGLGIGSMGQALSKVGNEAQQTFKLTGTRTLDEELAKRAEAEVPKTEVIKKALKGEELAPTDKATLLGKDLDFLAKAENPAEAIDQEINRRVDNVKKGIAKKLTGREDLEAYDTAARDLAGTDKIEQAYDSNVKDQLLKKVAAEGGQVRPLTQVERAASTFMDAKPLNEITDKSYGSKLSRTMDDASTNLKQVDTAFSKLQDEGAKLNLRSTPELDKQIIAEIESGNIVSPEAQAWSQMWDRMRDTGNNLGLNIRELKGYIPHIRLDFHDYKKAIVSRFETQGAEDPELLKELARWNNGKVPLPSEVPELVNEVKASSMQTFNQAVIPQASVTKVRDELLPDWLRETNLAKLQNKWVAQIKKQYAFEPHIEEMQKVAKLAEFKGDQVTAERLRGHIDDLLGNRQDWPSEILAQEKQYLGDLDTRIENSTGLEKKMLQARAAAPRFASQLTGTVYANLLSSPKATTQNLASPALTAFSELGMLYGTKLYFEAMIDTIKAVRYGIKMEVAPHMADVLGVRSGETITTRNLNHLTQNAGIKGIEAKGINPLDYKKHRAAKVLDMINNGSLALFQATDDISKATLFFMGKRLAKDIIKDPNSVMDLIKSPSYRSYISGILEKGDTGKVEREVTKYLMGHTLLNFDKVGMSEYGRRVGPMLRSFTKYPSYYFGRAAQPLYEKGLVKGGAELVGSYGAPLATFMMLDRAMDSKDSSTVKGLTTAQGLTGWAPATSVMPMFENNFGLAKTPMVGLGVGAARTVKSLLRDDTEPTEVLGRYLQQTGSTLAPGMGLLKLFGEDIPAIKGDEVDKSEPVIERRIEGVKSIFD